MYKKIYIYICTLSLYNISCKSLCGIYHSFLFFLNYFLAHSNHPSVYPWTVYLPLSLEYQLQENKDFASFIHSSITSANTELQMIGA